MSTKKNDGKLKVTGGSGRRLWERWEHNVCPTYEQMLRGVGADGMTTRERLEQKVGEPVTSKKTVRVELDGGALIDVDLAKTTIALPFAVGADVWTEGECIGHVAEAAFRIDGKLPGEKPPSKIPYRPRYEPECIKREREEKVSGWTGSVSISWGKPRVVPLWYARVNLAVAFVLGVGYGGCLFYLLREYGWLA